MAIERSGFRGRLKNKKMVINDERGTVLYNQRKDEIVKELKMVLEKIESGKDIIIQSINTGHLRHKENEKDGGKNTGLHGMEINYFIPSECELDARYLEITRKGE